MSNRYIACRATNHEIDCNIESGHLTSLLSTSPFRKKMKGLKLLDCLCISLQGKEFLKNLKGWRVRLNKVEEGGWNKLPKLRQATPNPTLPWPWIRNRWPYPSNQALYIISLNISSTRIPSSWEVFTNFNSKTIAKSWGLWWLLNYNLVQASDIVEVPGHLMIVNWWF